MEMEMATLSMKTMMATLLAGSLALGAGGMAYAKTDGATFDPAKFQQRIEQRVDKALTGTDASVDQKKQVADIMASTFKDMKPLRDQRIENRKAMQEALQAPSIDPAKIEAIRTEQMRVADQSSKVFTKGLTDAGKVLTTQQRQAFFKNWNGHGHHGHHHGKRG
jgi:Spy/CpxP family protein refolding chaperone